MRKLFGKGKKEDPPPPPKKEFTKDELKEKQRNIKRQLNRETRELDRNIFNLDNLRKKAQDNLRKELSKNPPDQYSAKVCAKQIAQNEKQKNRVLQQKAKIQNMEYGLDNYFSNLKMMGVMKESADIMHQMNNMMDINEMAMTAAQLEKEMMKMGVINEQIEDAMDTNDDLDDEDIEIDKIIESEQQALNKSKNTMDQHFIKPEENKNEFDDLEKRFSNLS